MTSNSLSCPFCGCPIDFNRLPVVATNISERVRSSFRNAESDRQRSAASGASSLQVPFSGLQSGTPILYWIDGWPVIRRAATDPNRVSGEGAVIDRFRRLLQIRDSDDLEQSGDLPAYLCLNCKRPLPAEIETHEVFTVGVVGTIRSGKSHFLAAMIRDAYRLQIMSPLGISDFAPDERTGIIYQSDYYSPVYLDHKALARTPREQADIRFRPMSFKVLLESGNGPALWNGDWDRRIMLLFHDVSGEVLKNRDERATVAPFLRRADAIIFLIDPVALEPVRQWRIRTCGIDDQIDSYYQTDLLRACLDEIGAERIGQIPVAICLSKSDIINKMLARPFTFNEPPALEAAKWLAQRNAIHSEVLEVLRELHAYDIIAASKNAPNVTFHAVAPLGVDPDEADLLDDVKSLRCADPVANIILSLLNMT
jgi:hypothetical protein